MPNNFLCSLLLVGFLFGLAPVNSAIVTGRVFDRFISIWLENQDFAEVIKDPDLADLKRYGILQTRYYANTHPSQPNYLASVAGDYFGLNHDESVRVPDNVSTIVDLLDTQGISWGGYFEHMPGPGYLADFSLDANGTWDYVKKHNHFASFDSINKNGTRLARLRSFEAFKRDLAAGTVPQFVMMSPDMLNDGHNTTLAYATKWAHEFLLPLLQNKDKDGSNTLWKERTVIQLTYDEADTYDNPNRIVSLLLGTGVPQSLEGTADATFYTHYSLLATAQHNWALPTLGRYDAGANVFQFAAAATGHEHANRDPPNLATLDNSLSYAGFLHNETAASGSSSWRPVPPPNLKLVGAGGKGVLPQVRRTWRRAPGEVAVRQQWERLRRQDRPNI
ncbi:acid phosphatase [Apiospora phragmitis]|uniref:Acid phosphatase n=1 Tax=Apiospora phragmitis TaxID=2905665 RepID=A0ABR1WU43_9PEZI